MCVVIRLSVSSLCMYSYVPTNRFIFWYVSVCLCVSAPRFLLLMCLLLFVSQFYRCMYSYVSVNRFIFYVSVYLCVYVSMYLCVPVSRFPFLMWVSFSVSQFYHIICIRMCLSISLSSAMFLCVYVSLCLVFCSPCVCRFRLSVSSLRMYPFVSVNRFIIFYKSMYLCV